MNLTDVGRGNVHPSHRAAAPLDGPSAGFFSQIMIKGQGSMSDLSLLLKDQENKGEDMVFKGHRSN